MSENKNNPAFPLLPYKEYEDDIKRGYPLGLTKREYFAAMFIQGMLANPTAVNPIPGETRPMRELIVISGLNIADELLKQLEA
jgi:hypothetical protein